MISLLFRIHLTPVQSVVAVWLFVSLGLKVFGHLGFCLWLLRRRVRLIPWRILVPGYLEEVYLGLCRRRGSSPHRGVLFIALSFWNLVLAIVAFVGVVLPVLLDAGVLSPGPEDPVQDLREL